MSANKNNSSPKLVMMKIGKIIIGKRKREVQKIEGLKKSISQVGMLNPITIDENGNLIAGDSELVVKQGHFTTN